MHPPVVLTVDTDAVALRSTEAELRERYARDYEVICTASPDDARTRLEDYADSGTPVALVIAALSLGETRGTDFLADLPRLHPRAKRALLIGWGEWGGPGTGNAISEAAARGKIDHYVTRPLPPPDEMFHGAISSFLLEWAEGERIAPHAVRVVGDSWSGRAYELRNVLQSCAYPHNFSLADSPEARPCSSGPRRTIRSRSSWDPTGAPWRIRRTSSSPAWRVHHPERMTRRSTW